MEELLYYITLHYATYGVVVNEQGIITEAPPIARWAINESIDDFSEYVKQRGGKICRI